MCLQSEKPYFLRSLILNSQTLCFVNIIFNFGKVKISTEYMHFKIIADILRFKKQICFPPKYNFGGI